MKAMSLKLREDVFKEVEKVVREIRISRNAYINDALVLYNTLHRRKFLRAQLQKESRAVREVSLEVLHELENMEEDAR